MDFIITKIDVFIKSSPWMQMRRWTMQRVGLFGWYVILVPGCIALLTFTVGGAFLAGSVLWAVPLMLAVMKHHNRGKPHQERAGLTTWLIFITLIHVIVWSVTLALALVSAFWGWPIGMAIGIAVALIGWILASKLQQLTPVGVSASESENAA